MARHSRFYGRQRTVTFTCQRCQQKKPEYYEKRRHICETCYDRFQSGEDKVPFNCGGCDQLLSPYTARQGTGGTWLCVECQNGTASAQAARLKLEAEGQINLFDAAA